MARSSWYLRDATMGCAALGGPLVDVGQSTAQRAGRIAGASARACALDARRGGVPARSNLDRVTLGDVTGLSFRALDAALAPGLIAARQHGQARAPA
jgi:hypothetical protein